MYSKTKYEHKKHFCMHCLQCFTSEQVLSNHKDVCISINGKQAIEMPKEGSILKYENYHKQLDVPFVIYADFEAIVEKTAGGDLDDGSVSYTTAYQKHTCCGYGYKLVCCYDNTYSKPVEVYRGEDASNRFMKRMLAEVNYCKKTIKAHFNKDMIITSAEKESYKKEVLCHICGGEYTLEDPKVRDHCHVTSNYRGAAHRSCNVNFRLTNKISVVFHNLRAYDSHFIMQEIGKFNQDINVIPNNMEMYLAFMLGKSLVFIDSFQYMSSSLENLVKNLPEDGFKYTSEEFHGKELEMTSRKDVYPYDYMDSFEKFKDTKLPSKEEFYSILNDEHVSDENYKHAQKVWKQFKMKNMCDYHDLYLKTDTLLLADVCENFRGACKQYYKLDPCHYFTSPGLAWDAMLKMTGVKLELISDVDMFQFIEKGLRGGISNITHRHGVANNKYMSSYDEKSASKYIMYLDANNLYGLAMSQCLPTGGFTCIPKKMLGKLSLDNYKDNSRKGIILEVDLEYPEKLHDKHNSYPLAPEKL